MQDMLNEIYKQRQNYIIIGLTGRIGSGCTTAANILSKNKQQLSMPELSINENSNDDYRKKYIIKRFYDENWHPFTVITARDIITTFILEHNIDDIITFVSDKSDVVDKLNSIRSEFEKYQSMNSEVVDVLKSKEFSSDSASKLQKFISIELPSFSQKIKTGLGGDNYRNFSKAFQLFGDNIRRTGQAIGGELRPESIYAIADRINKVIKGLRKYNEINDIKNYFVIDAFRNPFEALYFKERYAAFYLIAIKAPEPDRRSRLYKYLDLTDSQIDDQDKKENPEGSSIESYDVFVSQNISVCIQKADIHINNVGDFENNNFNEIKGNLIKYISLIQHPGLITPQRDEKLMQIAYTAKLNSGCISRQVGAVVTNADGAIVSIGWNDVPQGQTQCLLRSMSSLLSHLDNTAYSDFEKKDERFLSAVRQKLEKYSLVKYLKGRNICFCFKSLHNEVCKDKNQVHTRALHAEENAFLQIVKHGGQSVKNGTLYCTASPCELCSKKSYQLGIKRIVYVEPYPGIAVSHIIKSGTGSPNVDLFTGAIGPAYHKLYEPILSYKDELNVFLKDYEEKL